MAITLVMELFSFVFLLIIMFVYLGKKKLNTYDNAFYIAILFISITGLVLEFVDTLLIYYRDSYTLICDIINNLYMLCIVSYVLMMITYIIYILRNRKKTKNKEVYYAVVFVILLLIEAIVIAVLPNNYHINKTTLGYEIYVDGAGPTFCSVVCYIEILFTLFYIAFCKNKNKRYAYITWVIVALVFGFIIFARFIYPGVTFLFSIIAYGTIIMFFIVQSPDARKVNLLKDIKENTDEINKKKLEFLSNISKEMRMSLHPVVVLSNDIIDNSSNKELKENMNNIIEASYLLMDVTKNILDINLIEDTSIKLNPVIYEFEKEMLFAVKMSSSYINNKPINFIIDIDKNAPYYLYGDVVKIKQVINNLLSNAFKYTDSGSVTFTVKANTVQDKCTLTFEVKDTGIGIEDTSRLFTKFDRMDLDKNSSIKGTGLGLVITRNLVNQLGGELKVESVYGSGSTFTFTVTQDVGKSCDISEDPNSSVNLLGKRALICDNNKFNLNASKRFLENYNVSIVTCSKSDEIFDLLNQEKFDLIFYEPYLDTNDPKYVLRKIKNISGKTKVIVLTSEVMNHAREKYLSEDFDGYLFKPLIKKNVNKELNEIFKE